jgi:hypothetical protein
MHASLHMNPANIHSVANMQAHYGQKDPAAAAKSPSEY